MNHLNRVSRIGSKCIFSLSALTITSLLSATSRCVTSFSSPIWNLKSSEIHHVGARSTSRRSLPSSLHVAGMQFSSKQVMNQTEQSMTSEGLDSWKQPLPYEERSHGAVKIVIPDIGADRSAQADFDLISFKQRLEATIIMCKGLGKTSLWVDVPMTRASFIEEMVDAGLEFHHAEGQIASLFLWTKDSECKVPPFATHRIGVGAMVTNSRNEILCVRELRKNFMPWKIPGGLSDLGEQLDEAVQREVMEETSIPTRFMHVIGFRHSHGLQFGRSDLYFVCRLEAIEEVDPATGMIKIPEPIPCEDEIESAAWIPLDQYRNMVCHPDTGHPMMRHVIEAFDQEFQIKQIVVKSIVPGRKSNPIYYPHPVHRADKET